MTTPQGPRPPEAQPTRGESRNLWPYLLIGAGVLLLLANFGWLRFGSLWSLLDLWPVVLIAVGVDLLTAGRYRSIVVVAAVVVAAAWWAADLGGVVAGGERIEVAHELAGARAAEVVLDLGVGEVVLVADAPADTLLSGTILSGRGETIQQRPSRSGDVARVEIASRQTGGTTWTGNEQRRWTLSLTERVPVDLRVDAGVGRTTLDLRDAELSALRYSGGVGEATVTLPDDGGYGARFDLGVGATSIRLPDDVEARMTVRTGLGRVSVNGDFDRVGDVYTTRGYDAADPDDRIELAVEGGIGGVTIVRVR